MLSLAVRPLALITPSRLFLLGQFNLLVDRFGTARDLTYRRRAQPGAYLVPQLPEFANPLGQYPLLVAPGPARLHFRRYCLPLPLPRCPVYVH